MDGAGTITWEEFVANGEELVRLSDEISDHWKFTGDKKSPGQAYLTRQEKIFVSNDHPIYKSKLENETEAGCESDEEWSKNVDIRADPFEATGKMERPLILEHHILWSMSYSVPMIYFNGWMSDHPGINPVRVEVAQRSLRDEQQLAYGELSQAIHPILGRPYLHLHPCGSRELLLNMTLSTNKVASWLSAIAPAALLSLTSIDKYQKLATDGRDDDDEDGC